MHTDTSLIFNPDTYEDEVVIVNSPVNPEDIKKYRIKEMWFFDKESSRMGVRILGIAPIRIHMIRQQMNSNMRFLCFGSIIPKLVKYWRDTSISMNK
jgi:hypothetical protein